MWICVYQINMKVILDIIMHFNGKEDEIWASEVRTASIFYRAVAFCNVRYPRGWVSGTFFSNFFCQKCQNQNESIAGSDSIVFCIWIKDEIPFIYLFPCSGLLTARHLNSSLSCLKHRNLPLFSIFVFHTKSIAVIYPAGVSVLPVIESLVHTLSSLRACDGSISWYY